MSKLVLFDALPLISSEKYLKPAPVKVNFGRYFPYILAILGELLDRYRRRNGIMWVLMAYRQLHAPI